MDINANTEDKVNMKKSGLFIMGTRGSVPVSGDKYREFGGTTSAYLYQTDDEAVFLDAGTGIIQVDPELYAGRRISVILTHLHLDHLAGLPFLPALGEKNREITVYGRSRDGLSVREGIAQLMRPPFWPCGIEAYPAAVHFEELTDSISVGDITFTTTELNHPGGCVGLRTGGFVLLSDCDLGKKDDLERAVEFARGADLILCDAQYTEEEYAARPGYGHSTPAQAVALKEATHADRMYLIHHDPRHDDDKLRAMEKEVDRRDVLFAREGDVLSYYCFSPDDSGHISR